LAGRLKASSSYADEAFLFEERRSRKSINGHPAGGAQMPVGSEPANKLVIGWLPFFASADAK
jgi:hypothetical protein